MEIRTLRELGQVVRAARRQSGTKQSELAKTIGVASEWISRLETGSIENPSIYSVLKICEALKLHFRIDESPALDITDPNHDDELDDIPSFMKRG